MREHYIADPGYVLNSCDYSQQELVALAQTCYTEYSFSIMRDLINNDIDLHGYIAARVGKKFEDLPRINAEDLELIALYKGRIDLFKKEDKDRFKFLRSMAKALNFGLPGGLGPKSFVNYAKGYGVTVSLEEAKVLCALWKDTFPEMQHHLSPEPMLEMQDRFVSRVLTGRLRVNCTFCAACNTKFQGLAADISKEAGWALLREGFFLSNMIHDEYLALIPFDRHATARARHMQKLMEDTMRKFTPDVKCKAEPTFMFRWSKAAELWVDGEGDLIPWEMVPLEEKKGKIEVVPWEKMNKEAQKVLIGRKHALWEQNERMFDHVEKSM